METIGVMVDVGSAGDELRPGRGEDVLQPDRLGVVAGREGAVGVLGTERPGVLAVVLGGIRVNGVPGLVDEGVLVPPDVVSTRTLVANIIGVEGDEQHRSDLEVVETREAGPIAGKMEAGGERVVPTCAVVQLGLVVADAGHPRHVGGRTLDIQPEISPHLGRREHAARPRGVLVARVDRLLVGVGQVAVHQMEQWRRAAGRDEAAHVAELGHRQVRVPR